MLFQAKWKQEYCSEYQQRRVKYKFIINMLVIKNNKKMQVFNAGGHHVLVYQNSRLPVGIEKSRFPYA